MSVLENIYQEINSAKDEYGMVDYINGKPVITKEQAKEIVRKHIPENDGWIPVEEGLPENSKHEGAFCPKYQVMTDYGVTEGWYNPNAKGWFVLLWFMTGRFDESEIDIERGDVPRVVFIPDGGSVSVSAWQPLQAQCKPKEGDK